MSYRLLDSGFGRKLEALGPVVVDRQAAQAFWSPALPKNEWRRAEGYHVRSDKGGGHWEWRSQAPAEWVVEHGGLKFRIRPTPFGHIGLFAEQADSWRFIRDIVSTCRERPQVLNLFAYTGGSTLAAAAAGASVVHVDAAPGVVSWARDNAAVNSLDDRPVRWIVDDCRKFVEREVRRGTRYDALILDPPTFGRGARGETWKIEEDLPALLDELQKLMSDRPLFLLLSGHSPGFSGLVFKNLLKERFGEAGYAIDHGEMTVAEDNTGRVLPSGTYCRFVRRPTP